MSAIDNARAAVAQGELNEELGVPVSWSEVRALHTVIRDLIAEHERLNADVEWEFGVRTWINDREYSIYVARDEHDARRQVEGTQRSKLLRRVKAGPWLPTVHTNGGL